ncbi:hypothetical protein PUNSTDRAFT_77339 [Punctularia strigosozonata HHB-11173 SS5]|uniref:Integrase zinc-binding domain-containing protein n=1 Tax=Punctularia strigosozonata (strain HHB-11173) TaxID=741275 RepID=R7S3K5_PUNST|nr:uncharacterized protein PUNSTDRAFT_77339 [Punctularia strigosozonata HHB-11173 SS5]EIN03801.1 hypothetical protein PUNSTDRAFT_77339 [Punctularia strigosozonata HHB-11173 SS5]
MYQDIEHHVRSCHECQIRSVKKVHLPVTISQPATIFTKVYLDVMYMPVAKGFRYIVAARDDLTLAAEGRALKHATAEAIARFFWEDILCRYGSRGHFILREALVKACKQRINKWPDLVPHAFFADKVMTRKATGFSPFYLLHGVDPVLPFDLTEATYLVDGFKSGMNTSDLLALRIRQLEKRPEDIEEASRRLAATRWKSKLQFERWFRSGLNRKEYNPGDLVLIRNTRIEKELNRKSKPRYLGPMEVVWRTRMGSYALKELDGTPSLRGVAGFRLIPYYSRNGRSVGAGQLPRKDESMDEDDPIGVDEDSEIGNTSCVEERDGSHS